MVPFLLVRLLAEISCGHNTMATKILGEQKQHQLTKNTFMIKNATFFPPLKHQLCEPALYCQQCLC